MKKTIIKGTKIQVIKKHGGSFNAIGYVLNILMIKGNVSYYCKLTAGKRHSLNGNFLASEIKRIDNTRNII